MYLKGCFSFINMYIAIFLSYYIFIMLFEFYSVGLCCLYKEIILLRQLKALWKTLGDLICNVHFIHTETHFQDWFLRNPQYKFSNVSLRHNVVQKILRRPVFLFLCLIHDSSFKCLDVWMFIPLQPILFF